MTIEACDPPRHLAVSAQDEHGTWRLEATLAEANGTTELTFVHHLDADAKAADVGPGWEYYLDMLVASRDADPMPDFDAYLPAQAAYYESRDAAREEPHGLVVASVGGLRLGAEWRRTRCGPRSTRSPAGGVLVGGSPCPCARGGECLRRHLWPVRRGGGGPQ